jgi:hypothetical protein
MRVSGSNGDQPTPAALATSVGPVLLPAESVPDRRGVVACLGRAARANNWALPRLFRAVAIMGEVTLDLTQVQIGPGVSEIEVLVFMGEVKILIPHNLHVECEGNPVMGEFKVRRATEATPAPEAPTVRIGGTAVMGQVTIKVIDPNAPANWRDKWRTARGAKQLAREQERLDREQRRAQRRLDRD